MIQWPQNSPIRGKPVHPMTAIPLGRGQTVLELAGEKKKNPVTSGQNKRHASAFDLSTQLATSPTEFHISIKNREKGAGGV